MNIERPTSNFEWEKMKKQKSLCGKKLLRFTLNDDRDLTRQ
jgi:hypothetical protein